MNPSIIDRNTWISNEFQMNFTWISNEFQIMRESLTSALKLQKLQKEKGSSFSIRMEPASYLTRWGPLCTVMVEAHKPLRQSCRRHKQKKLLWLAPWWSGISLPCLILALRGTTQIFLKKIRYELSLLVYYRNLLITSFLNRLRKW